MQKAVTALVSLLFASAALAQSTPLPAVNVDRFALNPSMNGTVAVHGGALLPAGSVRVGILSQYARNLSLTRRGDDVVAMDRLYGTVTAGYGLTHWLNVAGQVPVVLTQGGGLDGRFASPGGSSLAAPTVSLRGGLSQNDQFPVSISLEVGAALPLGEPTALVATAAGMRPTPYARLNIGKSFEAIELSAELNALEHVDITGLNGSMISDEIGAGVGFRVPLPSGFSVEGSALVEYEFKFPGWSTQLHAGARWQATEALSLVVAAGPAFGELVGTPDWRAFGGILFNFDKAPAEQKKTPDVAGTPLASTSGGSSTATTPKADPCTQPNADPSACPDADLDSDGIANRADQCVSQGEDKDGFNDTDGCPETDNDGDSIADASDKCPNEAGVPRFNGCPIPDADKDGIADADDACPNEYGMVAARGCAVKDADGDSFADAKDACPTKAGIAELKGCPAGDRDADGVFDHLDNCPRERGLTDNGGCPARKKQLVLITPDSLELRDKVFFVAKKARIQPRSNKLLKQVATVLKQAKHIEQVRIEVHGDDDLNADKNRKLTQDRADAVRAMLVKAGIVPNRLVAVGMGNDKPLDPKRTFKAKATNRRVEIHVIPAVETPST